MTGCEYCEITLRQMGRRCDEHRYYRADTNDQLLQAVAECIWVGSGDGYPQLKVPVALLGEIHRRF